MKPPVDPPLPNRPQLLRASPDPLPDHSLQTTSTDDESSDSQGPIAQEQPRQSVAKSPSMRDHRGAPKPRRKLTGSLTSEEKLLKLRDDIDARLLFYQQHRPTDNQHVSASSPAAKRVSPIREEDGATILPSPNAALVSPVGSAAWVPSSLSHASSDSARTVRGAATAQPTPNESQRPLRTPSYPFPRVGTPQSTPGFVHQSFLNLSPTVDATQGPDSLTPRKRSLVMSSNGSTPSANEYPFLPQGTVYEAASSSAFPTPNLYDMVLQLNSEPGIEQWWATVSNLMHDHFKADRAALFMPLDPTDLENVPWGQKTTFTMTGLEQFVSPQTLRRQTSLAGATPTAAFRGSSSALGSVFQDVQMQKLHPERLRPSLPKRHSFAGHGGETRETVYETSSKLKRPAGPQRVATHAPTSSGSAASRADPRSATPTSIRHSSFTDPNFSSIEGEEVELGPHAEVFPTLRPLESELNPLIEIAGVNRVVERGRLVAVTRDYTSDQGSSINGIASPRADHLDSSDLTPRDTPAPSTRAGNLAQDQWSVLWRDYDEYEQHPGSPWAQSPAPSPAIQSDEELNPFFPSEQEQVEQSFDTENDSRDYSNLGPVEAIGVERASTIIHIPLIHPTLSQPMQSLSTETDSNTRPGPPGRNNTLDLERKAPIAVLSVLSNTVPYPPTLLQTLELFGPHLATSFAIAQQFSSTHYQAVSIRHRRTASGRRISTAPMVIQPASLEEIVNADLERPLGSVSAGSMTSPSDYSGRSKTSPSGSMAGTPAWDPQHHSWASKSQAGTPAHVSSENIDSYFDAKKNRTMQRKGSTAGISAPIASKPSASVSESNASRSDPKRGAARPLSAQEPTLSRGPDANSLRPNMQHTYSHLTDVHVTRRHSLLHSYGADFESSFGNVVGGASAEPGAPGHARKSSYSEDMPPPSERLLRTIIDSVPVQIFTAKPDTGSLSWVNSKFIIYRGQEPGQILSDPWQAIHPEDRNAFLATWHRSLRTAQQLQQKVRLERFDGTYRWFYVRAAPLKDKRQKIVHWIGTMMDFHEQHLAELNAARQQETAASETKYRTLANSSPQIVFAVLRSRGVTFCNSRWLHYSGQTEQQALGLGFMDHVHPEDISKCRLPTFEKGSRKPTNVPTSVPLGPRRTPSNPVVSSASSETDKTVTSPDVSSPPSPMPQRKLSELADTGILKVTRDADGRPSYSTEVRLKSRDGDYRWHLVRVLLAEPMMQNADDEETWYGTCTDINDHKALERDLKETMDEKTRFLSNMSHEIRTPLNGITGMVNFLIDSSLTAEQMEHVNIIRASTEGLRGLINDILDLSKAEAGMIQLNMDWLYVRALIEEVNDLTSAMAIDKGLELNYIVEEDVPVQVKGDRFRLRQILLNVVGNAIKFTQRGEVFVRCSTVAFDEELGENELFIKFEVIDTGRGFNEKEAEFLFKRFSQIDGSSTRQHGGTGLGLVISRQLAQLHGGDMSAKGVPGQGSTFTSFVKATLPTKEDQPPVPLVTSSIPILPMVSPLPTPTIGSGQFVQQTVTMGKPLADLERRLSPKSVPSRTPFETDRESPSVSSASSDPSVRSVARTGSHASQASSSSSLPLESGPLESPMKLALPPGFGPPRVDTESSTHDTSSPTDTQSATKALSPSKTPVLIQSRSLPAPLYSILVICPLKYSRKATIQHIEKTLPSHIPHQITAQEDPKTCLELLRGSDPIIFTHIVIALQDIGAIIELLELVISTSAYAFTNVVIITDLAQRRSIMQQAPDYDYETLNDTRRVRFVFKPLKPSRLAVVFDPQKEREMSLDRNQDSAQQVAVNQKQVFEELSRRLGDKEKRVLLVEDNHVNQMVILKFLAKAKIKVDTVQDGVQCLDKVFAQPPGHYAIILCDLHMPNKDGYQTCREIRKWERSHRYPHLPIIALSANVLGDVYQKCVDAGFNSYMTKPVDFKELSTVLMMFMDPNDPNLPHKFMKMKGGGAEGSAGRKKV